MSLSLADITIFAPITVCRMLTKKEEKEKDQTCNGEVCLQTNCMDLRLVDDTVEYMNKHWNKNCFDNAVIPGSSLGFLTNETWRNGWYQILDISIKLHHATEIFMIDHEDCGYYKEIYGQLPPAEMFKLHVDNLVAVGKILKERYPHIRYSGKFMKLNGECIDITSN